VLIFLTGRAEVNACVEQLKQGSTGAAFRHAQGRIRPVALHAGALRGCNLLCSRRLHAAPPTPGAWNAMLRVADLTQACAHPGGVGIASSKVCKYFANVQVFTLPTP
jgi:hypothetical protein